MLLAPVPVKASISGAPASTVTEVGNPGRCNPLVETVTLSGAEAAFRSYVSLRFGTPVTVPAISSFTVKTCVPGVSVTLDSVVNGMDVLPAIPLAIRFPSAYSVTVVPRAAPVIVKGMPLWKLVVFVVPAKGSSRTMLGVAGVTNTGTTWVSEDVFVVLPGQLTSSVK